MILMIDNYDSFTYNIVQYCRELGADTYLSGASGRDYLDVEALEQAGINILFQDYHHGEYPQMFPKCGFLPRLSALDLFMNLGQGETVKEHILSNSCWQTSAELNCSSVNACRPDRFVGHQ